MGIKLLGLQQTMDAEDDDDDIVDISINYTDLAGNAGVAYKIIWRQKRC